MTYVDHSKDTRQSVIQRFRILPSNHTDPCPCTIIGRVRSTILLRTSVNVTTVYSMYGVVREVGVDRTNSLMQRCRPNLVYVVRNFCRRDLTLSQKILYVFHMT